MRDEDKICRECGENLRRRKSSICTDGNSQCPLSPQRPQSPELVASTSIKEHDSEVEYLNDSQSQPVSSRSDEQHFSVAATPPPVAPVDGAKPRESKSSTESSKNSTTVTSESLKSDATNSNSSSSFDLRSSQTSPRHSAPPAARVVQESFCHVSSEKLSGTYYLKLLADYSMQFRVAKLVRISPIVVQYSTATLE